MKLFFNNPFTAPDIQDLLRDRNVSFRKLSIVLGSGVVLASTLVGGYHIGQWFLGGTVGTTEPVPLEVSTKPFVPTIESRLAELGGGGEQGAYDVAEVVRRTKELAGTSTPIKSASTTSTMEDRMKELSNSHAAAMPIPIVPLHQPTTTIASPATTTL